ncbi:hypothetical protein AAG906_012689 [Vitis piasezkii]
MDFIIGLPKSEDSGSIIVVVDRFSKYATFIAAPTDCTAEETTRLFLKHVVKYWGLPKFIISDRDPRFTGKFWTELFKLMGSSFTSPQAFTHKRMGDREGERHRALPKALHECQPKDWAKLLDVAPIWGEVQTFKFAKGWHEQVDIARSYLDKAAKKMKKPVHKGLVRRYEGPFPYLGRSARCPIELSCPEGTTTVVTSYDKEVEHVLVDRVIETRVPPATEYLQRHYGVPERIERFQARRGRLRHRWGECQADPNEPPMALYRAGSLETPRVGRVWKVLEKWRNPHNSTPWWKAREESGLSREI